VLRIAAGWGWILFLAALAVLTVWWVVTETTRGNARLRIRNQWDRLRRRMGVRTTLCPSCKYNNERDCRQRNRPFATICEDYRRR
jgi:hypothetical protein